ncbi:uncharacterized protein PRCAT00002644001 [Priceomyces carsonii]|uniref:uncharacterized protein n=1 Tax=Priceomyces carsonii TaxID=28549 RepID=UPI002ED8A638|nr:unnamed protein product [Priceomyces carsonii]
MTGSAELVLSDGTKLFYKDWGSGEPIVFSHGWPLTSDAFEDQMMSLALKGFRVIAHDRRGHGRSSQSWEDHTMDQYADDLAELVEHLKLKKAVHIGHSTGGGEVARYIGRHGTLRVLKAILIGAIPPLMIKTKENPLGTPVEVFDDIRSNVLNDRSQFFKELASSFYGFNQDASSTSIGLIDSFWLQGMQGSIKALYDCIGVFSETDQHEDLKKMDIPTLVIYGDNDQIVPPAASSEEAIKLLPQATKKVYVGASHGLCSTHKKDINKDIYDFITR